MSSPGIDLDRPRTGVVASAAATRWTAARWAAVLLVAVLAWSAAGSTALAAEPADEPADERSAPLRAAADEGQVTRLAGTSRFGTAVAISDDLFDDGGARDAVLVSATGFADALPGTVLARAVGGPLLLTHRDVLPAPTRVELQRVLGASGTIWLVGGTAVIGEGVATSLEDLGYDVRRLAGDSRFATAVRVAEQIPAATRVVLADGGSFTDGLVAAAAAAASDGVLLLTAGDRLDAVTAAHLSGRDGLPRTAIGAPAAAAVPDAEPLVGRTPGHTSRLVADRFHPRASVVGVASDRDFPDGLAGGLHAALRGGPLLLTAPEDLDVPVLGHLDLLDISGSLFAGYTYGGPAALADTTLAQVAEEVRGGTRTIHTSAPHLCLDRPEGAASPIIVERFCQEEHQYEVIAVLEHPDAAAFPGQEPVQREATRLCSGQVFTDYVGTPYAESRWFLHTVVPTADSWAEGDRRITCTVYDVTGRTSASAYGSGV